MTRKLTKKDRDDCREAIAEYSELPIEWSASDLLDDLDAADKELAECQYAKEHAVLEVQDLREETCQLNGAILGLIIERDELCAKLADEAARVRQDYMDEMAEVIQERDELRTKLAEAEDDLAEERQNTQLARDNTAQVQHLLARELEALREVERAARRFTDHDYEVSMGARSVGEVAALEQALAAVDAVRSRHE